MQEEREWGQGEGIDVFERSKLEAEELEEIIALLEVGGIDSFVFGILRERIDYHYCTVLRRYFIE